MAMGSGVDVVRDSGGSGGAGVVVAPFVAKTYRMVDDPATDAVIYWGIDNNSFVVADPFALSRDLLPAYFKHANFSSFVRQLNTYGFRKVDPDRWEFAHQSFLRGQTHLLSRISRRSSGRRRIDDDTESELDSRVAAEVARLRREQRGAEEEVRRMSARVAEMERRPRQLLAFVLRVLGDPEVLQRLASRVSPAAAATAADDGRGPVKRARLCADEFNAASAVVPGVLNCVGTTEMGVKEEIDPWPVKQGSGSFLGLDSDAAASFLQAADPFGTYASNYELLGSY